MESVVRLMFDNEFYRGKRVFVTGHTGFKGTWLCRILIHAGAIVTGYSLEMCIRDRMWTLLMAGLAGCRKSNGKLRETLDKERYK